MKKVAIITDYDGNTHYELYLGSGKNAVFIKCDEVLAKKLISEGAEVIEINHEKTEGDK